MPTLNRSAIIVVPKQPFLDWLHAIDPSSGDITLEMVREDATMYLLPECDDDEAVTERLQEIYDEIFEEELLGWWTDGSAWPADRTFELFQQWFECQFYSTIIDLCNTRLIREQM